MVSAESSLSIIMGPPQLSQHMDEITGITSLIHVLIDQSTANKERFGGPTRYLQQSVFVQIGNNCKIENLTFQDYTPIISTRTHTQT